jgi:UTP:GlnB (protein PII) uridylyltransferase
VIGARMVDVIGKRFRLSKKQVEKLVTLVRWHMFAYESKMTDASIRRFIKRVGVENINDMMLLRVGDRKGGGSKATSWRLQELQRRIGEQLFQPMTLRDLAVDGADVMRELSIPPSRKVGDVMNTLFDEVMEDTSKNEREYLLQRIRELA